jgi:hypothetical protein
MVGRVTDIERINGRLSDLHKRLQDIATLEGNSAAVGGVAAQGHFEAERDRIIKETDALLDRWEALLDA